MTIEIDVKRRIAAYRETLAEATKECPLCQARDAHLASLGRKVDKTIYCAECEGTVDSSGRVARFPKFRQPCRGLCHGKGYYMSANPPLGGHELFQKTCGSCNGTGWQVALADWSVALTGLTVEKGLEVLSAIYEWLEELPLAFGDPMPSSDVILAKGLELVIEILEDVT